MRTRACSRTHNFGEYRWARAGASLDWEGRGVSRTCDVYDVVNGSNAFVRAYHEELKRSELSHERTLYEEEKLTCKIGYLGNIQSARKWVISFFLLPSTVLNHHLSDCTRVLQYRNVSAPD